MIPNTNCPMDKSSTFPPGFVKLAPSSFSNPNYTVDRKTACKKSLMKPFSLAVCMCKKTWPRTSSCREVPPWFQICKTACWKKSKTWLHPPRKSTFLPKRAATGSFGEELNVSLNSPHSTKIGLQENISMNLAPQASKSGAIEWRSSRNKVRTGIRKTIN